jgi:hypothetical protein
MMLDIRSDNERDDLKYNGEAGLSGISTFLRLWDALEAGRTAYSVRMKNPV